MSHQWPKSLLHTFGPEEPIHPTLQRANLDLSGPSDHALLNTAFKSFVKFVGTIIPQLVINSPD